MIAVGREIWSWLCMVVDLAECGGGQEWRRFGERGQGRCVEKGRRVRVVLGEPMRGKEGRICGEVGGKLGEKRQWPKVVHGIGRLRRGACRKLGFPDVSQQSSVRTFVYVCLQAAFPGALTRRLLLLLLVVVMLLLVLTRPGCWR